MSITESAAFRRQRGLTLIELIIFIVIVGVALAGVLTVFNVVTRGSADPMIRKQMLAIAEALMEEIQAQPFTWCDPDDQPAAATATSAAGCTGGAGGANDESKTPLGPESGESRTAGSVTPFDNVSDYNGLAATTSISGTAMPAGYSASVAVTQDSLNGIAAADSLKVAITVSHGTDSITLEGYRTRHSPNVLP